IDLERSKVYITNVVKDRPPENRDPRPEEIALYKPFLLRQIALIQPRVIASLGRFAMDFVLETFDLPQQGQKISELHGQTLDVQAEFGRLVFVPLFHPAVALYARNQRESMEKDFQVLQQFL
ncbi:MAG TPA: uracil-DNA glycosylase, partial [Anaerolineales bacterium]|nr:uracil-DNA glycosylase [Anaerolineales bacterium]